MRVLFSVHLENTNEVSVFFPDKKEIMRCMHFFFAESRDGHHQFILIVADLLALESTESKCSALCRCNDRCVVDSVSTSVRSKKKRKQKKPS